MKRADYAGVYYDESDKAFSLKLFLIYLDNKSHEQIRSKNTGEIKGILTDNTNKGTSRSFDISGKVEKRKISIFQRDDGYREEHIRYEGSLTSLENGNRIYGGLRKDKCFGEKHHFLGKNYVDKGKSLELREFPSIKLQKRVEETLKGERAARKVMNYWDDLSRSARQGICGLEPRNIVELKISKFNDLLNFDNHAIQRILCEIDNSPLVYSLSGANKKVKEHILSNMSRRSREVIEEEIGMASPATPKQIKQAKKEVVDIVNISYK